MVVVAQTDDVVPHIHRTCPVYTISQKTLWLLSLAKVSSLSAHKQLLARHECSETSEVKRAAKHTIVTLWGTITTVFNQFSAVFQL